MARYFSSFPDWNAGRTVVKYRYHRAKGAAAMRYTLMHKEIPVLDMDLDEATSSVQKIAAVYQPRHLPLGTGTKKDGVDRAAAERLVDRPEHPGQPLRRAPGPGGPGSAQHPDAAHPLLRPEPV